MNLDQPWCASTPDSCNVAATIATAAVAAAASAAAATATHRSRRDGKSSIMYVHTRSLPVRFCWCTKINEPDVTQVVQGWLTTVFNRRNSHTCIVEEFIFRAACSRRGSYCRRSAERPRPLERWRFSMKMQNTLRVGVGSWSPLVQSTACSSLGEIDVHQATASPKVRKVWPNDFWQGDSLHSCWSHIASSEIWNVSLD